MPGSLVILKGIDVIISRFLLLESFCTTFQVIQSVVIISLILGSECIYLFIIFP